MTDKQSEALRWADVLVLNVGSQLINRKQAAAELRRLNALNAELVEALKDLLGEVTDGYEPHEVFITQAKAALAKAEGK